MSSKRKSVENLQSPSRIFKSSKRESVEEEKKEISMRRKKSSPLQGLTPSVELETFYDPNEWEDIEKMMKEDPTFIPFWVHPEHTYRLSWRQAGYLPYAVFDYLFPPPKLSTKKNIIYYEFASTLIDFIVSKKHTNAEVFQLHYNFYYDDDIVHIDPADMNYLTFQMRMDYKNNTIPEIYIIQLTWRHYNNFSEKKWKFSHSQLFIINNIQHTFELYDPQFSQKLNDFYFKPIFEKIKNEFLVNEINFFDMNWLKSYKWFSFEETCPPVNFQEFESKPFLPEPFRAEGFCLLWSVFLAELRIQYAEYSANTMKRIQDKLIKKLSTDIDFRTNKKINPFSKFMYEYTLYWAKKKKIKRRVSV